MKRSSIVLGVAGLVLVAALAFAADEKGEPPRTLYVVATAHLDTQWRWTVRDTIEKFVPATLRDNFALFEKYPDYTFSFEGAFRYMLAKEYYPAEYERLKGYVAQGRWRVAGSWVDAVDTNMPSPESLFRQALYGNGFFSREFGRQSRDVFLPDCFGFGFALPGIAAHSGLVGFSSQKLTWGSSVGVPFDVGLWEGVDGSHLVAALNPGDYAALIDRDLSADPKVLEAVDRAGNASGLYVGMRYFGVGDVGGAPDDASVAWLEKAIAGKGPVTVRSTASDQLARDLTQGADAASLGKLPRYRGELLMTSHGAGCYTSQAAMKRFNRKNERLADAAERAAVAADWLGGASYPREALREAWVRFLWHQFHDDLTGTSIPEAYEFSWNDETIVANQLAGVLSDSVGAVVRAMDTEAKGVPLVVYNPLSIPREDIVEADVIFDGPAPGAVRVLAADGSKVPAQVVRTDGKRRPRRFPRRGAVGRFCGVRRAAGRCAGRGADRPVDPGFDHRERPLPRRGRRQRGHRLDPRQTREQRAPDRADPAPASPRRAVQVARLGGGVRRSDRQPLGGGRWAGADPGPRVRPRPCGARGGPRDRGFLLRADDPTGGGRRRRPGRGRDRDRLAHEANAAQGGVPAGHGKRAGHL